MKRIREGRKGPMKSDDLSRTSLEALEEDMKGWQEANMYRLEDLRTGKVTMCSWPPIEARLKQAQLDLDKWDRAWQRRFQQERVNLFICFLLGLAFGIPLGALLWWYGG